MATITSMVDTHCHLDAPDFVTDIEEVVERARDSGVTWFVTIGSGRGNDSAIDAVALANQHDDMVASIGIHPLDASVATVQVMATLAELAEDRKVVAIGETGLDYRLAYAKKDEQRTAFRKQIRLAKEARKPLVIHARAAAAETLSILREEGAREVGGVFHSFTEDRETAFAALDLNFDISFSAYVLLHEMPALAALVRAIPIDRLLVESNAPVLAPDRSKRCEPVDLVEITGGLAAIRAMDADEFRARTCENAVRRFGLVTTA